MLGTLKFSSRVQYGRNKKNIPYYLFEPLNTNIKYIVASRLGYNNRVDYYAEIDIIDDTCKPNRGAIKKILGPINDYNVTKKLILLKNKINHKCIDFSINEYSDFQLTPINEFTYTIDPKGSKDIDDAFSYELDTNILKIHITDLTDIDIKNMDELINIASTFYDDDENINMLPSEICEKSHSLLEKENKNVISLIVNLNNGECKFLRTIIQVNKNLSYEEADQLFDQEDIWIKLKKNTNIFFKDINDSHDFIEKIMIFYNSQFSKYMKTFQKNYPIRVHKGLRIDVFNKLEKSNIINENLKNKICYHAAEYVSVSTDDTFHKSLDIDKYTHATSPLRRIIDLINQRIVYCSNNIDIDMLCNKVNEKNKLIKKANRELNLLRLFNNLKDVDKIIYDAIIVSFEEYIPSPVSASTSTYNIRIFIPDLDIMYNLKLFKNNKLSKVFTIITTDNKQIIQHNQSNSNFELHLFQKIKIKALITPYESRLYKKIQFIMIDPDIISLLD